MDAQVADPLLGTLIDGRYHVRGRLAAGATATVYAAADERLGRTVAVKVIHPPQPRRGQAAPFHEGAFADTVRAAAGLTHPNAAAFYGHGVHEGLPYLVTEYVRGRSLRDVLAERGRLSPAEALAVLEPVLSALAAAHRAGLVHRAVKPENILVADPPGGGRDLTESVVKLTDLGLAAALEAGGAEPGVSAGYVAPEFVADGRVDPRGDVYAAGIVLFEMLTGRPPYEGARPVEVAWQHVEQDVPAPSRFVPGLPPALDDLVAAATRRNPAARPAEAGALLGAVREARHATVPWQRPAAQETMVVSQVRPAERPSWARLPETQAEPRTPRDDRDEQAAPGLAGLLAQGKGHYRRLMSDERGRIALIAGAIVVTLLVLTGGWWLFAGRYQAAPQLVNLTKQQAEQVLRTAGLDVAYEAARFSDDVPKDVVLTQDPAPGEDVAGGGTVTLVLSAGPEKLTVPDVSGKTWDLAVVDLQAEPWKLKPVKGAERYDDLVPKGTVLETEPKAGEEIQAGAEIKVVLSKGRAPITMPLVVGKNLDEARRQLENLRLKVTVEYVDSDKPYQSVVNQNPPNGSGLEAGATVTLQVSKNQQGSVMPQLRGWRCGDAENHLRSMGLQVDVRGVRGGDKNEYRVDRQFPGDGSQVRPGQRVVIRCER